MTSTYFVKYSVAARIHIWPLKGGFMGLIRSIPKCGKAMVWPYLAAHLDEYGLHLQILGMHDTF